MIPNPFRKNKCLVDLKGHHNPCGFCWWGKCQKCLVFNLADFADTVKSNPILKNQFMKRHNEKHGLKAPKKKRNRKQKRN